MVVSTVETIDERSLRHPWEWPVFVGTVTVNLALLVGAVLVIAYGPSWLADHPFLKRWAEHLRALAVAALLGVPTLVFLRNTRHALTHGNGILLSADQMPDIHGLLTRHCAALGMPLPTLYVSQSESHLARAYSSWRDHYIVLGTNLLQADIGAIANALGFQIAREVGRLRLGHTVWWDELLVSYVVRIPVLRNPLGQIRTYSADRYGGFLEPHGVRGLIALAAGRRMLPRVDVGAYLRMPPDTPHLTALLARWSKATPPVARRVHTLYRLGLFKSSMSASARAH